ncbi:MAG: DUF2927 domain-containing protein, partial [Cypionkella sp.]
MPALISPTRILPVMALCLITACMPQNGVQVSRSFAATNDPASAAALALPQDFAPQAPRRTVHSNAELAHTFLSLSFQMESGRVLPVFSRFEGPITVRMIGDVPASARADLTRLIARLRTEAGLDVREVSAQETASINIDFQPRAAMARVVPM